MLYPVLSPSLHHGKVMCDNKECIWGKGCVDMSRSFGLLLNSKPPHSNTCVESSKQFSIPVFSSSNVMIHLSTNEGEGHMVGRQSWKLHQSKHGQRRVVEEGMFSKCQKMKIGILCELHPVWLICVNKLTCSALTIFGCSTEKTMLLHIQDQGYHVTFLCKVLQGINSVCLVNYCESETPELKHNYNMVLVSGRASQKLYNKVHSVPSSAVIGCFETTFPDRLREGKPSWIDAWRGSEGCWHCVRHSLVGGATEYVTLLYVKGLVVDPQVTLLRRTI
jgi:hypothetical protein